MNIYWGDLHNHCGITYGFGTLENALKRAAAQLDFCCVTGHAMWPDMYEKTPETEFVVDFHNKGFQKLKDHWEEVRSTINQAQTKDFITFQSYEFHSSEYGDYHLISKNPNLPLITRNSPKELVEDCGREDTIAIPHHIGYPKGYRGIDWNKYSEEISPFVEVYSKHGCSMNPDAAYPYYHNMGPRDDFNTVYEGLKRGYRFGFGASTDHHAGYPGSYGDGRIAVLADEKTKDSIWQAIKAHHTYAVTGDKIRCDFQINGAIMGSQITANQRSISYHIETEDVLDKIVLYKNLKPIHILNGELYQNPTHSGKYKIRIEMGWGDRSLYSWNGTIKTEKGEIIAYNPYFRGRDVLAPSKDQDHDVNTVNDMQAQIALLDSHTLTWSCDTVGNKTTLHPCTSSVLVEVEGTPDTVLHISVNDKQHTATIAELCEYGYTTEMKFYHSQSFKIHKAIPAEKYHFEYQVVDSAPETSCDFYHLEVAQKNGQWAYVTPIWVNQE